MRKAKCAQDIRVEKTRSAPKKIYYGRGVRSNAPKTCELGKPDQY